jgi:thymidylate kinase
MISVALIGPDGSGKTTIARRVADALPIPARYLYMGVNLEASEVLLPTTRALRALRRARGAAPDDAGPRDHESRPPPAGLLRGLARELKSLLALSHRLIDEWYRQYHAWRWQKSGMVVLFDRHYYPDYYAYDIAKGQGPRPLHRRIHGWLLEHVFPKPDLLIYLDAPAEVLFERKQEGSVELLERRRQDYLAMADVVPAFVRVDATLPLEEVVAAVSELICRRAGYSHSEAA